MKLIHHVGPQKVNATKKLSTEVPKMLRDVISMVNFIKIRPLTLVEFLLFSIIRWGMIDQITPLFLPPIFTYFLHP